MCGKMAPARRRRLEVVESSLQSAAKSVRMRSTISYSRAAAILSIGVILGYRDLTVRVACSQRVKTGRGIAECEKEDLEALPTYFLSGCEVNNTVLMSLAFYIYISQLRSRLLYSQDECW
nr:hypothetical protein CFP56_11691 [Quercus suber]